MPCILNIMEIMFTVKKTVDDTIKITFIQNQTRSK